MTKVRYELNDGTVVNTLTEVRESGKEYRAIFIEQLYNGLDENKREEIVKYH